MQQRTEKIGRNLERTACKASWWKSFRRKLSLFKKIGEPNPGAGIRETRLSSPRRIEQTHLKIDSNEAKKHHHNTLAIARSSLKHGMDLEWNILRCIWNYYMGSSGAFTLPSDYLFRHNSIWEKKIVIKLGKSQLNLKRRGLCNVVRISNLEN